MMPVIVSQLANDLLSIMRKPSDNPRKVSKAWADAYNKYVQPAIAGPAIPVFTGAESDKMALPIQSAMKNPASAPSAFAAALANGMESFWLVPPIIFNPPGGTGLVTLFPGKPSLISGLTGVLSSPQKEEAAAQAIAAQLDIATKTVTVTYTIPPNPPVITPIA